MSSFDFAKASAHVDPSSKTIEIWDLFGTDYRDMTEEVLNQVERTLSLDPSASFLGIDFSFGKYRFLSKIKNHCPRSLSRPS